MPTKREVYETDDGTGNNGAFSFLKIIGHSRSLTSGCANMPNGCAGGGGGSEPRKPSPRHRPLP